MFIRQGNRVYFKQPMAYKLRAQYTQNVWFIPYFNKKPVSLAQRPDNWFFLYNISDNKKAALAVKLKSKPQTIIIKQ
ncbi:unnamed protein product [Adineta steineri]|nr:unnamed protein product [Adineta steineri]